MYVDLYLDYSNRVEVIERTVRESIECIDALLVDTVMKRTEEFIEQLKTEREFLTKTYKFYTGNEYQPAPEVSG